MNAIRSVDAYYPLFSLGCRPSAVLCTLSIVEANGDYYLKTPFAFLKATRDADLETLFTVSVGKYYRTEADCLAYLDGEYPHWKAAEPIMSALFDSRHYYGDVVGPGRLADKIDVSVFHIHQFARGHRSFKLKAIKAAVRKLTAKQPA